MKHCLSLKARRGFTLIELLVVISIIIMAASMALVTFRDPGINIKRSGNILQAIFLNAGQLAISQKVVYFLYFDKEKSLVSLYKNAEEDDAEGNEAFDKTKDELVGEQFSLLKGVKFSEDTPLMKLADPYVGFRSNGLMFLPSGVEDKSFKPPTEADIILEQPGKTGKMYLDFVTITGRIRKISYLEE